MHEITRYLHTYYCTTPTQDTPQHGTGQPPSGSKNTTLDIRMQHATTYFVNHEKLMTF